MENAELINELLESMERFKHIHRRLHDTSELSMSDRMVCCAVLNAERHQLPPPKMGDIARRAALSSASISQIAARLEAKGLVERYSLPEDRRTVYVRITPLGKEFFASELADSQEIMRQTAERLGKQKCSELIALSREIESILNDIQKG